MNELIIQTHDFNNAKKQLKEFSERIPSRVDLQAVKTHVGPFDLFNHNVTGEELNKLSTQIQGHLIAINNLHIESVKEFGQVYKALEALDKDYIQAIIISVKAAEKASEQAQESAFKAEKNSLDITETIKVQTQMINVLQQFKEKFEKYERLEDINEIWNDCQELKDDVKLINFGLEKIVESIEKQIQRINALEQFKEQIENYEHLKHVNEIWNDCQTFKKDIQMINSNIEKQKDVFDSKLKEQMSYEVQNKVLFKKIKLAYTLAGAAVGITLFDCVLHILGII